MPAAHDGNVPFPSLVATAAVSLALALGVAGCGAATDESAPPAASPSADGQGAVGPDSGGQKPDETPDDAAGHDDGPTAGGGQPATVPEVLRFEAEQVSGEGFDATSLAGTDTVLWFWAPWCTECAAAAPEVQAAADAAPDVEFVGVSGLSSDVADMQAFVDRHGLTFTQLADTDGGIYTRFGIIQQDVFVLVSEDGAVEQVDAYSGDVDLQQLVDESFG